jgi:hypothetical protein
MAYGAGRATMTIATQIRNLQDGLRQLEVCVHKDCKREFKPGGLPFVLCS